MNKGKDLKMGDKVLIDSYGGDHWTEERIFVKHGKNNGIIAVHKMDADCYNAGETFGTIYWPIDRWHEIKPPKYKAFDSWHEKELRGKWVKEKGSDIGFAINCFCPGGIIDLTKNHAISFSQLLESYIFVDTGEPVGILE